MTTTMRLLVLWIALWSTLSQEDDHYCILQEDGTCEGLTDGGAYKEGCYDEHPQCAQWADEKECARNPIFMLGSCRKSCHVCDKRPDGEDVEHNCYGVPQTIYENELKESVERHLRNVEKYMYFEVFQNEKFNEVKLGVCLCGVAGLR